MAQFLVPVTPGTRSGSRVGTAIGPFHPDEIGPRLRAKAMLSADGAEVYATDAEDPAGAAAKVRTHLAKPRN